MNRASIGSSCHSKMRIVLRCDKCFQSNCLLLCSIEIVGSVLALICVDGDNDYDIIYLYLGCCFCVPCGLLCGDGSVLFLFFFCCSYSFFYHILYGKTYIISASVFFLFLPVSLLTLPLTVS